MNKLSKYNDFIIEKEFQKIIFQLHKLYESAYTYEWDLTNKDKVKVGDEIEWDLKSSEPLKDVKPVEFEWSFDQKSKIQKFKDNISKFKNYLNEPDPEVEIKFEHPLVNMVKEFLSKLKDKEQIKKYFIRILDEVKSLPYPLKKKLLIKISFIFLSYVSLTDITPKEVLDKEPIMSEVKIELQNNKENNIDKLDVYDSGKKSSFNLAQELVKSAEAGYSNDRNDSGNYIDVSGGKRFLGTNHGISAPILAKYFREKGIERLPKKEDMEKLTYKTALEIYKKDYWDKQHLGDLKSQSIANVLYDGCVNQGPGAILGVLKNSLEEMDFKTDTINSWNDFKDELLDDVNKLDQDDNKELFGLIKKFRLSKYKQAPTYHIHGDGWQNRLDELTFNDDTKTDIDIA